MGVAAGITTITSAFPGALDAWRVLPAIGGVIVVMLIDLRGVLVADVPYRRPT